jgi:hypothetical protein
MATVLEECTTEDRSSVMRILWAKGLDAKAIHKEIFLVYGGKRLSRKEVHNWVEKSSQGHSKFEDDALPRPHVVIATEARVKRLGELIRAERRIMVDGVATALGCSYGLAYSILHDR